MAPTLHRCPRCGEPARFVVMMARVRFAMNADGSPGKAERITHDPRDKNTVIAYSCGGGHKWREGDTKTTGGV